MGRLIAATSVVVAIWCCACSGAPVRRHAQLRIVAEPDTARVYVNDRFVAVARVLEQRPEPLRPGVHYVTIDADGYFPHDVELELPEGETTVRISLRPIPP